MPVQILNRATRDEIYRRTLAAVRADIGQAGGPDDPICLIGRCLDVAWHGYRIIRSWPGAPRTIIQAGSAGWPRVPADQDDGQSPTHFAYQWDPKSDVARLARAGIVPVVRREGGLAFSLPEMHVWLGCPDSGEIIDFTVGLWPLACKATLGLDWPGPAPADYFWNFGTRRPEGVHYLPDRDAIDLVVELLRQQGRSYP